MLPCDYLFVVVAIVVVSSTKDPLVSAQLGSFDEKILREVPAVAAPESLPS